MPVITVPTDPSALQHNQIHRANFTWLEDNTVAGNCKYYTILLSVPSYFNQIHLFLYPTYSVPSGNSYIFSSSNSYRRYLELSPLLPFGMMLIISTIIFILIIFRRWPGLVAGIVAGCLTSISIYLLLLTLKEQKLVYE